MSLREKYFFPIYSKDRDDLYLDFYQPCIENSVQYDRMTGYFGSGIFVVIMDGLKKFVQNQGKIRIICSPIMKEEDYESIKKGYEEKLQNTINEILLKEIEMMALKYPKPTDLLTLLVKHGVLEIKLALFMGNEHSSYSQLVHDKIGIFKDKEGNKVTFGGSMNETFSGVSNYGNLESFSVYTSWENDKDSERVKIYSERFDEIWNKKSKAVITYDFPDEVVGVMEKYLSGKSVDQLFFDILNEEKKPEEKNVEKWYAEKGPNRRKAKKHQVDVLNNWESRNRQGIFEMATGSGKTFTALCAVRKALENNETALIIVPSKILLNQWREEIKFVFKNENVKLLLCGDGNTEWKNNLLKHFSNPEIDHKRIILSTIQTASTDDFLSRVIDSDKLFIVVDEVHRSGSTNYSKIFNINAGPRIGLSATPSRYGDPSGTKKIYNYFKNEIEPKYDLFDAINDGTLTPYKYYFETLYLTVEEQSEWDEITKQINKIIAIYFSNDLDFENDPKLKMLLIKRARIVKKASAKISVAMQIIEKHYEPNQSWLIYCEDSEQLDMLFNELGRKGYPRYYYTSSMKGDREETLRTFEQIGGILVSIKCLDEGVDIPSISHALILASSTNPREYIQRRGRVLRKSHLKDISYIFDCVTLPRSNLFEDAERGLSIIKSEMARSLKFAEHAKNSVESIYKLRKISIEYDIDLTIDGEGGIENE